jgi:kynurenine formamidase
MIHRLMWRFRHGILGLAALVLAASPLLGQTEGYDPFPGASPWGPGDQAGATNTQTPARVLDATKLIKKGKVYRLGHRYEAGMPIFPGNVGWNLSTGAPLQVLNQVAVADLFHGEIGQLGTQLDTLGHFGYLPYPGAPLGEALYYNGYTGAQLGLGSGAPLAHLGVESLKPFFTRGVLLDVARYANGGQTLSAGQEITLAMVLQTMEAQGLTNLREGDVVLIRTGWEERWDTDPVGYYGQLEEPGIGLEAAQWLASKRIACVGSDNWGVEVAPNANAPFEHGIVFPVHHELLVKNGIPLQVSMHLGELAEDLAAEAAQNPSGKDYTFAYIHSPVPMSGATGSPGVPLAVR